MWCKAPRRGDGAAADRANEPLGPEGGFELVARDRYLLWIAVLVILLNVVNTTGQYVLNRLVVLFLPTSRETKYKAKAAIDTFFTRVGEVVSAGAVAFGQIAGFTVVGFSTVNVGLTIAWLGIAGLIGREHRRRVKA